MKWGLIPKLRSFYDLPRTEQAAMADKWTVAADLRDAKGYSLWCREDDYRVCLLFDLKGSVAGIQVSVRTQIDRRHITKLRKRYLPDIW